MRAAIACALVMVSAAEVRADDEAAKKEAQALVTDGVAALKKKDYDTALAKFEAAYAKFPSPKILLNLGTTYKEMGRIADSANTYQRYLGDPTVGADRLAEVRKILDELDKELVLLTIDVTPAGSSVSIDGGTAEVIGAQLVVRVEPGTHTIEAKRAGLETAVETVEGTKGTKKAVSLTLKVIEKVEEIGTGTGNQDQNQTTGNRQQATGNRQPATGKEVAVGGDGNGFEKNEIDDSVDYTEGIPLPSLAVQTRIDGKLRGAAFAIGVDYDPIKMLEVELAALLSSSKGVYAGARYTVLPTRVAVRVGGGFPIFFHDGARYGVRVAAGGEMKLEKHLSIMAELGFEHFFNPHEYYDPETDTNVKFEANVLVPIIGIQGSLR